MRVSGGHSALKKNTREAANTIGPSAPATKPATAAVTITTACFIALPPKPNDRDEQIATMDSQLRRTLPRFCSIAWFGCLIDHRDATTLPRCANRLGDQVRMGKKRRHKRDKYEAYHASVSEFSLHGRSQESQGSNKADGNIAKDNAKTRRNRNRVLLPVSEIGEEEERPTGSRRPI